MDDVGVPDVVGDRGSTLTDDQLESLRRELYGNQPDHGPDVDVNETRQALLDTLTRAVTTQHEGGDAENGLNHATPAKSETEQERTQRITESAYVAQFQEQPEANQANQYPEDVSLHQAQKLCAVNGVLEPSKAELNMEQLRAEVTRLKEHVRRLENTDGAMAAAAAQTLGQLAAMTFPGSTANDPHDGDVEQSSGPAGPSNYGKGNKILGVDLSEDGSNLSVSASRSARKRKAGEKAVKAKREVVPMSDSTGKRMVIKERTDQLAKEIRRKMRSAWGQGPDDQGPLPGLEQGGPDWLKGHRHPDNIAYQDHIANMVLQDIQLNLHPTSIPYSQQTFEACRTAAGTAFLNFAKRYGAQIDLGAKEKGARDNKRGRRWARKDLKQKKRSKAAARMEEPVSQNLLRMDYMSSEDSSEGDEIDLLPGEWQRLANSARTDQNGQILEHEKVLEVKTPRWRSDELQNLYERIDVVAQQIVAEAKGRGHAAAPLHRFKLEPLRQKRPPADVETWMLANGTMPDESTLPVPKRVKIGRPKGRKNKVNDPSSAQDEQVERSDWGGAKKRKRSHRNGEYEQHDQQPSYSEQNGPSQTQSPKRDYQAISSAFSADATPNATTTTDRALTIVSLPTGEDALIDPEIQVAAASREHRQAEQALSTPDLQGVDMVDLDVIHASTPPHTPSLLDSSYPADWSDDTAGGIKGIPEQEVELPEGERSHTRAELQDYLMRFSASGE